MQGYPGSALRLVAQQPEIKHGEHVAAHKAQPNLSYKRENVIVTQQTKQVGLISSYTKFERRRQ